MNEEVIGIGEVKVFIKPVIMTCYGLGSCVGLFVSDKVTGISGGAHVFLPNDNAQLIIHSMFNSMSNRGSNLISLRAKIAGGGHLLEELPNIGEQIVKSVKEELIRRKVFIVAKDIGGSFSRTVRFSSYDETLLIKVPELRITKIL